MERRGIKLLVILSLLVLMPMLARAQEKPNVVLNLTVQKEVVLQDEKGKMRSEWREVQSFLPGELLRYTITYRNEGKGVAKNVTIVDPIPAGTVYLANGAEGKDAEITFSLDGKTFQVPPLLKYTVKTPGAREQELFATPEMYTHIRWKLTRPVPAGGSGSVSFKVKVK